MTRRIIKTVYHGPDVGTNVSFTSDDRPLWIILAEMSTDYPHAQQVSVGIDPIGTTRENVAGHPSGSPA